MKTYNRSVPKFFLTLSIATLTVLGLVSWSPPTNESVVVTGGNVLVREGVIDVRSSTAGANIYGTAAGVLLGGGNDMLRQSSTTDIGRGFLAGTNNLFSSASGFGGVIGDNNNVWARSSLVLGGSNVVSSGATTLQEFTRSSLISGQQNVMSKDCANLIVGGIQNSVQAYSSLVLGGSNTIGGATVGSPANHSAAIGQLNQIVATYGWTMGYSNLVSASRGVAIGSGLIASSIQGTAMGRFNVAMQSSDVLVVGTGTSDTVRNTALRVTSDGSVILGRAQGDVSMGTYGN